MEPSTGSLVKNHIWNTATLGWEAATGSLSGNGEVHVTETCQALRMTEASKYTHIGLAAPGSKEDATVWQIRRLDESSGTVILWADGEATYNKRWDLRTTYDYS